MVPVPLPGCSNCLCSTKTADPLQHVQEAVLGKGEVCHLQLFFVKKIKTSVMNKNISKDCYYISMFNYRPLPNTAVKYFFIDFLRTIFRTS
jgi:hypothetical protein